MDTIYNSWKRLQFFYSADTTQKILSKCYTKLKINDAEKKSYDNCYPFIYYLEQGEAFYNEASKAPLSIKPIMLYYGLIHLIKACLLTVDPFYPSSTSVLAHGVSTRKRKKRNYKFLDDEIKVQRNGLCSYFSEHLFHVKQLEGEKFKMADLLFLVVELDDIHYFLTDKRNMISLEQTDKRTWTIPKKIEELYFMDSRRLKDYLDHKCVGNILWEDNRSSLLSLKKSITVSPPFRWHIKKQNLYLPSKIQPFSNLPDLIIHYLLLYNLSMISRYETEWWMELIKTTPNSDFPFITEFLNITEEKGPFLIERFLHESVGINSVNEMKDLS